MVITRLSGGLGNQLFQYATGRRLAHVHGAELKMDVSGLGNPAYRTVRHYELAPFGMKQVFATPAEIERFRPRNSMMSRILNLVTRKSVQRPESYIREAYYHFDPCILELPDGVYLDGYWQSERYFADIAETIRKEVAVTTPLVGRNDELAQMINGCKAVSLHVRRGDYVTDMVTSKVHGTCGMDYYMRAVEHVASKVGQPVFFLFSDDHEWVRKHLTLSHPMHFVDHNDTEHGYEDMRLMSLCRHHVIANSSFSWWGAWLNPRKDKIVIAPKRWFNTYDANTSDICPDSWIRL